MFAETFETEIGVSQIAVRLGYAVLLGGVIGFEREIRARPAGLRTNMMVALAAAMFTLLMSELASEAEEASDHVRIDTLRVIEAVVAGVAFLGAGAIIRGGEHVQGLTTGASLWMSGALGVAAGGGFYVLAIVGVLLAGGILIVVGFVEWRVLETKPSPESTDGEQR